MCVYRIYEPRTKEQESVAISQQRSESKSLTRNIDSQHGNQEPLVERMDVLLRQAEAEPHQDTFTRDPNGIQNEKGVISAKPTPGQ
jgi:hypothetical protein